MAQMSYVSARRGDRQDERQRDVDQSEDADREDRREDEQGPHPVDTNVGVRGEAVAHAGQLLPLADPLEAAAHAGAAAASSARRVVAGVDRADLLEDAVDVGGGDEAIVGSEQRDELVADGSLQVAEDLRPVGVVLQARGGSVEVRASRS